MIQSNVGEIQTKAIKFVDVPLLISAFSCGFGTPFLDGVGKMSLPEMYIRNIIDPYILEVKGDSMSPNILDGDFIIIDLNKEPKHNDLIACYYDGSFYVKRFIKKGFSTYLEADNANYPSIKLQEDFVLKIFGTCISFIRDF